MVYLDGKVVIRDNMAPGADAYLLPAAESVLPEYDGIVQSLPIPGTLAPGPHILAISVHNTPGTGSNDLRLGGVTLVGGRRKRSEARASAAAFDPYHKVGTLLLRVPLQAGRRPDAGWSGVGVDWLCAAESTA